MKGLCYALLTSLALTGAFAQGINDQVEADIDYGTFQDPSPSVRPRFRYWVNDASVNLQIVSEDIKAIGKAGAGGIELLGYYLYGDKPGDSNASPLQRDWTVYGFGSAAWKKLYSTVLDASKENNLIVDFALGPNQGAGVPAPYNGDGLLWDLLSFNVTLSDDTKFDDTLPGWGTGPLVAAVGASVQSINDKVVLSESSLVDITNNVSSSGHLSFKSKQAAASGSQQVILAYYLVHSRYRGVSSPAEVPAVVPQSPVTDYSQNGSWVVDHFSPAGAQMFVDFWKQSIMDQETNELLGQLGNYLWEDSQEFQVSTFWTPRLQEVFQKNRGYSINRYIPIILGSGKLSYDMPFVTDEDDQGTSHITDYQQTLTELNSEYLSALTNFSNGLGVQFSSQVVYNLPMDMLANVPYVNAPECETLGFGEVIDAYRQFAGPANLAGKRVISSEAGAIMGGAYQESISELLWTLKRSFAASVNNFVLHGFQSSDNYPNTSWPGFTSFGYQFSAMHGPRQPAFAFYSDFLNWVSRTQFINQRGIPKADIAFWSKSTQYVSASYQPVPASYNAVDLQEAGYTYEYLSPDNFALPEAFFNGTFAPNRQAFKALVVRENQTITTFGVEKLVDYAHAGLPIIFSGGIPSNFSGYNPTAAADAQESLSSIKTLSNVHIVKTSGLATTLKSLNILPRTSVQANNTWYTHWREDSEKSATYVYIYNDATALSFEAGMSTGNITFETTGRPYLYNSWTGDVTPISVYSQSSTHTTIPLQLAANQSAIIGFHHDAEHATYIQSGDIYGLETSNSTASLSVLRSYAQESQTVTLSNGDKKELSPMLSKPFALRNWTLIVESWGPNADFFDVENGPSRRNQTFQVPDLIPWNEISPKLANVSGIGYYSTSFNWPPASSDASGAFIDLSSITHTARVIVNGQMLPPVDLAWAKSDIGALLRKGRNSVKVVVSTTLGNGMRPYWDKIETSGKLATNTTSAPAVQEYGLIYPVQIVPYRHDELA